MRELRLSESDCIFPPSRIVTATAPCGGHAFDDCSHDTNRKLLKLRGLMAAFITKVREVTKARNFLGSLRKCTCVRPDGCAIFKQFLFIFSDLIFESRVVPGIPRLAARA